MPRHRSLWPRHLLWALLLAPWGALTGRVHGQAVWRFAEVTAEAGLTSSHAYQAVRPSLAQNAAGGVAAGDFDGDGHVDLYVVGGDAAPNRLFRNQGDGSFVDVAPQAGVALEGVSGSGPLFFDFDVSGAALIFSFNPSVGLASTYPGTAACTPPPVITTITYGGAGQLVIQPTGDPSRKSTLSTLLFGSPFVTGSVTCPTRTQ